MRKIISLIAFIGSLLWLQVLANNSATPGNINPEVYSLAMTAYHKATTNHVQIKNPLLTIVDFSLPSTTKRLWVINPKTNTILVNALVAHGKNSGLNYSQHFSNKPRSKESCLGLFLTGHTYYGHDGYALRLQGLEKGINNNADSRSIIVHGAWYVSKQFARNHHRLGRSWGCFAVNKKRAAHIISLIKGESLLFAYYPNNSWISHSKFLS